MSHISDDRFLELSLGLSLTMSEDAHVAECPACHTRLAEENDLSALLAMTDMPPAPAPDFVMQTVVRYERTRATREAIRVSVVLAATMIVGGVFALLGTMVFAPRIPQLLSAAIHVGVATAKLANAGAVLAASAPLLAGVVMMLATMAVSLWSALLLRLWRLPLGAMRTAK